MFKKCTWALFVLFVSHINIDEKMQSRSWQCKFAFTVWVDAWPANPLPSQIVLSFPAMLVISSFRRDLGYAHPLYTQTELCTYKRRHLTKSSETSFAAWEKRREEKQRILARYFPLKIFRNDLMRHLALLFYLHTVLYSVDNHSRMDILVLFQLKLLEWGNGNRLKAD